MKNFLIIIEPEYGGKGYTWHVHGNASPNNYNADKSDASTWTGYSAKSLQGVPTPPERSTS